MRNRLLLKHSTSTTMKKTSEIVAILVLIVNLSAINGVKEDILLVKPVLAPTSRLDAKVPETAKDFPLLMILARNSNHIAPEVPKTEGDHRPIYVKKLEDRTRHIQRK